MIALLVLVIAMLGAALLRLGVRYRALVARKPAAVPDGETRRILFPFAAPALSQRALDAGLRLARAEGAVLVPVFLARVPFHLRLDAPLPRQSRVAIGLQEAIEHRAIAFGVPVDARIERGRTERHAMRQALVHERFDRIVIAAAESGRHGFGPEDVAWLLENAPGEIVVLRPGTDDLIAPGPGPGVTHTRRQRRHVPGSP